MKKVFLSFLVTIGICFSFVACSQTVDSDVTDDSGNGTIQNPEQKPDPDPNPNPEIDYSTLLMYEEEMNPEYTSRTQALNAIFNPDELVFASGENNHHASIRKHQ